MSCYFAEICTATNCECFDGSAHQPLAPLVNSLDAAQPPAETSLAELIDVLHAQALQLNATHFTDSRLQAMRNVEIMVANRACVLSCEEINVEINSLDDRLAARSERDSHPRDSHPRDGDRLLARAALLDHLHGHALPDHQAFQYCRSVGHVLGCCPLCLKKLFLGVHDH